MNLLADESVDQPIVAGLRQQGHAVAYVAEFTAGVTDDEVLDQANASGSVLVTCDKDFGELVYRQGRAHAGILLVRLAGLSAQEKTAAVCDAVRDHGGELVGAFSVLSPGQLRIRGAQP
jgi:predicted nuclease of predicted toxin-antitoxin system